MKQILLEKKVCLALFSLFFRYEKNKVFLRLIYKIYAKDLRENSFVWNLFVNRYKKEYNYRRDDLSELDLEVVDNIEKVLLDEFKSGKDLKFDRELFIFLWSKASGFEGKKILMKYLLESSYANRGDLFNDIIYSISEKMFIGTKLDNFSQYFLDLYFVGDIPSEFVTNYSSITLLLKGSKLINSAVFKEYVDAKIDYDNKLGFSKFWRDMENIFYGLGNNIGENVQSLLQKSLIGFQHLDTTTFQRILFVLKKINSFEDPAWKKVFDEILGKLYVAVELKQLKISDFQLFWQKTLSYKNVLGKYKSKFIDLYEKENVSLQKYRDNTLFLGDCVYIQSGDGSGYSIGGGLHKIGSSGAKIQNLFSSGDNIEKKDFVAKSKLKSEDIFNPGMEVAGAIERFKEELVLPEMKYLSLFIGYNDFCGLNGNDIDYHKLVFKQVLGMVEYINSKRREKGLKKIHFFINTVPPFAKYSLRESKGGYKRQLVKFLERRKYNEMLRNLDNSDISIVDADRVLGSNEGSEQGKEIIKAYEKIIKKGLNDNNAKKIMLDLGLKNDEIFKARNKQGPIPYSEFLNDEWNYSSPNKFDIEAHSPIIPNDRSKRKDDSDDKKLTTDGMHLSKEGYDVLKNEILKVMDKYVESQK